MSPGSAPLVASLGCETFERQMNRKDRAGAADSPPSATWMDRLQLRVTWMDRERPARKTCCIIYEAASIKVWLMCFFTTHWFSSVDAQRHGGGRFQGYHKQESHLELIKAWHLNDFNMFDVFFFFMSTKLTSRAFSKGNIMKGFLKALYVRSAMGYSCIWIQ